MKAILKMFEQSVFSSKACQGESAIVYLKLSALFHFGYAVQCSTMMYNAMLCNATNVSLDKSVQCSAMKYNECNVFE